MQLSVSDDIPLAELRDFTVLVVLSDRRVAYESGPLEMSTVDGDAKGFRELHHGLDGLPTTVDVHVRAMEPAGTLAGFEFHSDGAAQTSDELGETCVCAPAESITLAYPPHFFAHSSRPSTRAVTAASCTRIQVPPFGFGLQHLRILSPHEVTPRPLAPPYAFGVRQKRTL